MSETRNLDQLLAAYGEPETELEDWELPYFDAKVALEDGRRFKVHGDQRDQRRALDAIGGSSVALRDEVTFATATSWAYLTRTGALAMDWPAFAAACAFVQMRQPSPVDPTGTAGAP